MFELLLQLILFCDIDIDEKINRFVAFPPDTSPVYLHAGGHSILIFRMKYKTNRFALLHTKDILIEHTLFFFQYGRKRDIRSDRFFIVPYKISKFTVCFEQDKMSVTAYSLLGDKSGNTFIGDCLYQLFLHIVIDVGHHRIGNDFIVLHHIGKGSEYLCPFEAVFNRHIDNHLIAFDIIFKGIYYFIL